MPGVLWTLDAHSSYGLSVYRKFERVRVALVH